MVARVRIPLALALALLLSVWMGTAAAGSGSAGVIALGDRKLLKPVHAHITTWLEQHGYKVRTSPLPSSAISTVTNCIVLDDLRGCASGVIDARATTESVIYVDVRAGSAKDRGEVTIVLHWFVKNSVPASARRICEDCSPEALAGTLDTMLATLETSAIASGQVKVTSKPSGLLVLVDNVALGVTPLEREVRAGSRVFKLVREGDTVAERTAKIEPGASVELTLVAESSGSFLSRSRSLPMIVTSTGAAVMLTGIVLVAIDEDPTGNTPTIRNTQPLGVGLMVGGAAITAAGAVWWRIARRKSAPPLVSIEAGGASVAWSTRF